MARPQNQPVLMPGASLADDHSDPVATDPAERLAQLEAENARLKAAAKLPQVVYEPTTPHGEANLAASATAGMTVAQVVQAIDEKRLPEPTNSYLCADGYYARRG